MNMRLRSNVLGMLSFTLLIVPYTSSLLASPPNLVLEVVPNTLELGVGEIGHVQVVVRNPSNQAVSNVALSWINNTGLEISLENDTVSKKDTIDRLPPNGEEVWNLRVSQKDQDLDAGKVNLRLDYVWMDPDAPEADPVSRLQFSELQVTVPAVGSVGDVAGVEVKSTLTTLSEQRPGFVYLLLENKSSVPLHVKAINLKPPEFIRVEALEKVNDLTLFPHEKRNIPYKVQVTDIVQPNKYILIFEINLVWEKGGQAQVGTLVASHDVDVGVFGESQILTLLGIPAFFLLPGFLMIVAFRLLWERGKPGEEAKNFPLVALSSEFWFVAISLSLLMAVLYPLVTKRNYLEAYGLVDVLNLWFGSIFVGAISFIIYYGSKALLSKYREKQVAEKTPTARDKPQDILRKLARQKLTMRRDRALIKINDKEYWTFLLQNNTEEDQTAFWVAPRIHITNREQIADLQDKVYELLDTGSDIASFLEFSPKLTLAWDKDWPNEGPYRVEKSNVSKFGSPDVMVEFDQ